MKKVKFKVSIQTFTNLEQNNHIYKILKKHPEGLTLKDIGFYAGVGEDGVFVKKVLNRIKNKAYIRQLGYYKLVYAKIHSRKLTEKEKKWN